MLTVLGSVSVAASGALSSSGAPGEIDDGAELLDQASISLAEAIEAALSSASGALGEVDLEMFEGKLVFNVDVGSLDVKMDASNGAILGQVSDDEGDADDGDEDD